MNKEQIQEAERLDYLKLEARKHAEPKMSAELNWYNGARSEAAKQYFLSKQPKDIERLEAEFNKWLKLETNIDMENHIRLFNWFLPHLHPKEQPSLPMDEAFMKKFGHLKSSDLNQIWMFICDNLLKADISENSFDWDCIFNAWQSDFFNKKECGQYVKQDFIEFLKQNYKPVSIKEQPKESDAVGFYEWVLEGVIDESAKGFEKDLKEKYLICGNPIKIVNSKQELYQEYLKAKQ